MINWKTTMTKKERKQQIDNIVGHYQKLNGMVDQMNALGIMNYDGKFFDAIWTMFDTMLDEIDPQGWIAWYIFDNECGNRELVTIYNNKTKKIKDTEDLAKVMKYAYSGKNNDIIKA